MVTAILVPLICIYFFWLTRKEMKENEIKWLATAEIPQEAILSGEIKGITEEKQRFYYHRYIFVQTLTLQTETKTVKAKKITPLNKTAKTKQFTVGDRLRIYGSWEGNHFHFHEYEIL